jgi:hypothetical protein
MHLLHQDNLQKQNDSHSILFLLKFRILAREVRKVDIVPVLFANS